MRSPSLEKAFREASTFFRPEGLRLRGVVRWPTEGKVQRMTPAHRAGTLLRPPIERRMASATSAHTKAANRLKWRAAGRNVHCWMNINSIFEIILSISH